MAASNPDYSEVTERCERPLITPPVSKCGGSDIAFAASAVEDEPDVCLYYSLADKDIMRAHIIRQ